MFHCGRPKSSTFANYYRPQNEVWAKVIFLHLSVILFTGGVPPGQVHPPGRYTPLGRFTPPDRSPWTGTPWQVHQPWQVHPHGKVHAPPGQVHPPAGTPPTPPARYTPGQVPPRQVHSRAGTPPGRYPRQCMLGYGQQACGAHPAGMHSCLCG